MKKNLPQIYRLHRIWGLPTKQSFFRIDPNLVCKYICVWFAQGYNGSPRGCRWGIRSSVSNALFLGEEQVFPRWGTGCWSVRKKTDGFRLLLLCRFITSSFFSVPLQFSIVTQLPLLFRLLTRHLRKVRVHRRVRVSGWWLCPGRRWRLLCFLFLVGAFHGYRLL